MGYISYLSATYRNYNSNLVQRKIDDNIHHLENYSEFPNAQPCLQVALSKAFLDYGREVCHVLFCQTVISVMILALKGTLLSFRSGACLHDTES